MALSSWIRNWKRSLERRWALHQALRRRSVARRHAIRPRLESLEDRWLLSTYVVTSGGDTNTSGTLRFGINQANNSANGITEIDFKVNGGGAAQTITLTSQLPTLSASGVYINGLTQGGTGNTTPLITLTGTNAGSGSDGLLITGTSNTVSGLILESFGNNGIEVSTNGANNIIGGTAAGAGNIISGNTNAGVQIDTNISGVQLLGNYIGTDTTGTKGLANGIGVLVEGVNDTIGGTTAGARNIISANSGDGVDLLNATGTLVEGNYIGTDVTGSNALANNIGIVADGSATTIGGTSSGARNIIAANSSYGISLLTAGTVVEGNYIGTNAAGSKAIGNGIGVLVLLASGDTIGGAVSGAGNVISGNSGDGVFLDGATGELVLGNRIGTDATGANALGNTTGIEINGPGNTIGGTASGARNFISGNTHNGVLIDSGNSGTQVQGNYIGTDITGAKAVANSIGIDDAGTGNTLGGSVSGARNVIAGNSTDGVLLTSSALGETVQSNYIGLSHEGNAVLANGSNGIEVQGTKNTIGGNSGSSSLVRNYITGNGKDGVLIDSGATGNQLQGNFIGLDISGTNGLGNVGNGVEVGGNSNTIGGTVSGLGNSISGNTKDGVLFDSTATGNLVVGNDVGTDYTGKIAVANGVGIDDAGNSNTIGGTASGARNIISGNSTEGVLIAVHASANQVLGNYIGTDVTGAKAVANLWGLEDDGTGNTLGGSVSGARNVISGNINSGIFVDAGFSSAETVLGNYIGLNAAGTAALANGVGIVVNGINNTIGGTISNDRNFISGNSGDGVYLQESWSGNQVLGNYIGTDVTGAEAVANSVGIEDLGTGNTLGGSVSGARNVISGNTHDGILLDSTATGETVQSNYIGLSSTGKAALANSGSGIVILQGNNNTIGGNSGSSSLVRNYIGGNGNNGLEIDFGSGNQVQGNFIGLDISGTNGLGNVANGVYIDATGNTIGGTVSGLGNTISASGEDGVLFDSSATGNLVVGNDVGTDYTGKVAVANSSNGIEIDGDGNTVGGTVSAARNIISGNSDEGVLIQSGASGNLVEGDYIGLNAAGAALGNSLIGIAIDGNGNTLGGTVSGARNIISANGSVGVYLGNSGNLVQGNYVGTDPTGSTALSNGYGFEILANNNTVGGTASGARNIIAGNAVVGVYVGSGVSGNQVLGNYIGTNAAGTAALANSVGVEDAGSGNTLGGSVSGARNVISGNSADGVLVGNGASGETVQSNYIGLSSTGKAVLANGGNGVEVSGTNNTIGGNSGSSSLVRNYISGNGSDGVLIDSGATGNQFLGNFIGLDITGTHGVGNAAEGVEIAGSGNTIGGTVSGLGNSISGNAINGVLIDGVGNLVVGDYVGTDYTGKVAVANSESGVAVFASGNTIGGTVSGARNIISGNSGEGVFISGASGNLVQGNYIGLNAAGAALGNSSHGIGIVGNNNTVGGTVSGARNIISANTGDGVWLDNPSNLVLGNYIGTDPTGATALGNSSNGVEIAGTSNTVGGTASAARNIISANSKDGVLIDSGEGGNQVLGNYIGTNAAGTAALANSVGIEDAGSGNTLGGSVNGAKNVISGNKAQGVLIDNNASSETVQGNYIGLSETGKAVLANSGSGVVILQGNNNTIGGNSASNYFTRNFITGNGNNGVEIDFGSGNQVLGNFIGVDISGTNGLGNVANGVYVQSSNNTIGGTVSGLGNTVSGSGEDGVLIFSGATGNLVAGNFVGTDYSGRFAVANSSSGVEIDGNSNTLGGTVSAARNVISGNTVQGVLIQSGASGNLVQGNYVGLTAAGAALGNGTTGIAINGTGNTVGGTVSGARNIISANGNVGVYLGNSGNLALGNYVGTDPTGSTALSNGYGFEILANNNTVGGTASGARNIISGNAVAGVYLGSSGNQVLGNYIGTNAAGTAALANSIGVEDAGSGNTLGGSVSGARNVISGNNADGVLLGNGGGSGDTVQSNYIGLSSTGKAVLANGNNGVEVGGNNNTIGGNSGSSSLVRNYIAGNGSDGVVIGSGTTGNLVQGNFIGLDISGTNGLGNVGNGVDIFGSSTTIGGTSAGLGNVISASSKDGVLLDSTGAGNLVAGNYVGTDYTGKIAVANKGNGIEVAGNGNTLGGTASAARNIISANSKDGVLIDGTASGTLVQGNYVGINVSSAALGNGSYGVEIDGSNNTIGNGVSGAANTIANNASGGVLVSTGVGDTISQDSIFANGSSQTGPGIVLSNSGNNNLAAPTLTSASVSGTTLTVKGTFTPPTANVKYALEFFASPAGDAEGKVFLTVFHDTPPNTNPQSFTYNITTSVTGTDPVITATLTDNTGDTSAFSNGVSTATWTAIGPAPITNGQTAGNGPVSGRITGIAADPSNASIVYIAAAGGGIWKSTNATAASPTWTPLTDNLTDGSGNPLPLFMGAVAETDATSGTFSGNQIVYAGTGEANNAIDSYYGAGILVSTNGGQTWTLTTASGAFKGETVSKIAIDPSDTTGGTAYAAVANEAANGSGGQTGIWKTTNFGQTWTNTTASLDTNPNNNASLFEDWSDVVVDPHTPSTVYAAQGTIFGGYGQFGYSSNNNGVYKSTNGGTTWTLLTGAPNGSQDGRISLALYDNGTTSELLVSIAYPTSNASNGGKLFKMEESTNGGSTFTDITSSTGLVNYMGTQGWYDQTIAIDPANSSYIYVGGQDNPTGNLESINGGTTWTSIMQDLNGNGPHSDDHAVAFDANGNLLDGNDGGIWRLNNPTNVVTQTWTDLNTNLQITQFTGIGVDTTQSNVIYGGTQDNGTDEYTGSVGWSHILAGDGGITRVDPSNHTRIYAEQFDINLYVSTNGGSTWTPISSGIAGSSVDFYAPYVLDASGNIYYGTNDLNYSSNQGTTWTQIGTTGTNNFNPGDSNIDAIAVNPVTNSNVVYVVAGGVMYVTKNAQAGGSSVTWTESSLSDVFAGSQNIHNTIAVDPSDSTGATAYAAGSPTSSGGLFKTTNFGGTWTSISGNLPQTPVNSVAVSSDGKTIFVGTDIGVYYTTNGGTTWTSYGNGLPNVQVIELELVPSQNLLVVGTHGRGVWEIVIPNSLTSSQPVAPTNPPESKGTTTQPTTGGGNPTPTLNSLPTAQIGSRGDVPVVPVQGSSSGINLMGTSVLANSPNNSSIAPSNGTQTATGGSTAPVDDVNYALQLVANKSSDADSEDSALANEERSN